MSPVLVDCRSVAMYHTAPLPIGGEIAPKDAWCQPSRSQLLVGVFKGKKGGDFLLVTNKHPGQKQEAVLSLDAKVTAVEKMDKKTGKWAKLSLKRAADKGSVKLELAPGDGELLKVTRTKAK